MLFSLLDMPKQTWLESNPNFLLILIATISIVALVVIFIYRRKKSK